ncbi:hypothetical protein RYH80_15285 [Halobaculum sp. MBLA0147]|uniref:hypothetical protein n=1 Tax=Halobaculum sp. MBLA0147 TaxID=3079934 RepID=UPI003525F655
MRGTEQIQTRGGTEVKIEVVEPLSGGGCRLDLAADNREWRVDVSASGTPELVTGWNSRGEVDADAELPDWIEDALAHVGRK